MSFTGSSMPRKGKTTQALAEQNLARRRAGMYGDISRKDLAMQALREQNQARQQAVLDAERQQAFIQQHWNLLAPKDQQAYSKILYALESVQDPQARAPWLNEYYKYNALYSNALQRYIQQLEFARQQQLAAAMPVTRSRRQYF